MSDKLTNDELAQLDILLDTLRVDEENIDAKALVRPYKPFFRKGGRQLPLEHEAAAENFLVAEMEGRCKLSKETRAREVERLEQRAKRRKPYPKLAKGRYHHKRKAATKRRAARKAWVQYPLDKLRRVMKQGVDIRQDQWDRLIAPVWKEGCRVKPTDKNTLSVYNMLVLDKEGRVLYHGPNQRVWDAQHPEWAGDV